MKQWCGIVLAISLTGVLGCAGTVSSGTGSSSGGQPGQGQGTATPAPPSRTAPDTGPGLSLDVLRRATYPCQRAASGLVQLTQGRYSEPFTDGTGEVLKISLLEDKVAWGDFDGDGDKDAAVVLVEDAGRKGVFHNLTAVVNANGEAEPVAQEELGDRIRVNFVTIMDGRILVDLTRRGPYDPVGSPSLRMKETYEVRDRSLALVDRVEVQK